MENLDVMTTTTIYIEFALAPILLLLSAFIILSGVRLRKVYKIDIFISITVVLVGVFMMVYTVQHFILSPYFNMLFMQE